MSHTHDVLSKLAVAIHCPEGENLAAKMGPFKMSVQPTVKTWLSSNLMVVIFEIRFTGRSADSEYCVV